MARRDFITKIGAAVLEDGFILLVRKRGTSTYILPGGKPEGTESDEQALGRELVEELGCELRAPSLRYAGEFRDRSADGSGRDVVVRLYFAELAGVPVPRSEIEDMVWCDIKLASTLSLAPSLYNGIIPYLIRQGCLSSVPRLTHG